MCIRDRYKTYGYCLNTLHSYEFDGSAGFAKMQSIMPVSYTHLHRKLAIWLMCVVFRLSISSIPLVPLALPDPGHARACLLYTSKHPHPFLAL